MSVAQLLAYRKGEYDPSPTLAKLDDAHVRKMVCAQAPGFMRPKSVLDGICHRVVCFHVL
jgi:hypothetical protein